ncbi:MAG: malonate decarboxylase holo-[acyl-carrier-protein] synthase [Pseudomonadota bacterium]
MRRHDLLRIEPDYWDAMLCCHPALADEPSVADWARLERPVIVRRRINGERATAGVLAGLPLPPCEGKRRLAFRFTSRAAVTAVPPLLLRNALSTVPAGWRSLAGAVLELGDAVGVQPRVFGALLWQHVTGLPYLSPHSDLDLLWSIGDEPTAALLVDGLARLDARGPVRLDGELELPDGAGLNWREFAQHASDPRVGVLVKTLAGVEVRSKALLFHSPGMHG